MSTADIMCIASDYCTEIINLNLESIFKITDSLTIRKHMQLSAARKKLLKQIETIDFDVDNDEQLKNYLFDIYKSQLDNDKYGINKRS